MSSSNSVPQPAGKANVVSLRIGSFSVGILQEMLAKKHTCNCLLKLQNIILTCVEEAGLDIMNFCEVGGHKQGLKSAGMDPLDLTIFHGVDAPCVDVVNNYFTAWGFEDHRDQCRLNIVKDATQHTLTSTCYDPELVIHTFANDDNSLRLHLGNLHIGLPPGVTMPLTVQIRQKLLRQALLLLDQEMLPDCATQRVVKVLVGDCNLSVPAAEEALQQLQPDNPTAFNVWHIHHTEATLLGDMIFVKGAHAIRVISW